VSSLSHRLPCPSDILPLLDPQTIRDGFHKAKSALQNKPSVPAVSGACLVFFVSPIALLPEAIALASHDQLYIHHLLQASPLPVSAQNPSIAP
jgi:hypothetical protein